MGVVARQTLKKSIVMIAGVLIGTISTLFIYPLNLSFYGNLQFIISAVVLLLPLFTLGSQALIVKFFPEFKTENAQNKGFLGLLFLITGLILISFFALSLIATDLFYVLIEKIGWSQSLFTDNALPIFGLLVCSAYISVVQKFLTNYQRVVVPAIFNEFLVKLLVPSIMLLSVYTVLVEESLKWLYVFIKLLSFFILIYYTYHLGKLHLRIEWSFLSKRRLKRMSEYALFGVLGSLSSVIAFRIDTLMVAGFTDFEKTGIYSIALFIANILVIPSKSVIPLVGAQISDHHNQGDIESIEKLYKKASLTLIIIGLGFFMLIWWNITDIFSISPRTEELMTGKMVVLYIGIAKLVDMVMGISGPIIVYSKYYRWNFIFILIMGGLTITTNLYFIPRIGFVGAAIATMISLVIFNLLKFCFIWVVYRIQPFDFGTFKALGIAGACSLIVYHIPTINLPLADMAIRCFLIFILFGGPIYYLKVSDDINRETDRLFAILLRWLGFRNK